MLLFWKSGKLINKIFKKKKTRISRMEVNVANNKITVINFFSFMESKLKILKITQITLLYFVFLKDELNDYYKSYY